MLTLILLAVLGAAAIVCAVRMESSLLFFFGGVLIFSLVTSALSLINIGNRFDEQKERYANLKMQVDDYNALPDSCKNVSFEYDIRKDVLVMNGIISEHKVMSRSPWVNLWYSREIGGLEKLRVYSPSKDGTKTNNN